MRVPPFLRGRRGFVLGIAGLASLALAAALRLVAGPATDVASLRVAKGRFVREVGALGTLQAVRTTPILVPVDSEREQRVAFVAKDGSPLAKGDVVVEFDPYQVARESADGSADLAAAEARIAKSRAEAERTARGHSLDRDVALDGLERAELFQITDETLYPRRDIIESRLDRTLLTTRADVATKELESGARLSAAEEAMGRIQAGKARLRVDTAGRGLRSLRILAPHDGLLVLFRNWRGETTYVGDSMWPGEKVAEMPDLSELEARVFVLESDALGLKAGLAARLSIEGRDGPPIPARVARVEPLAKPRDRQSPVKYFEAALSLERTETSFMRPGQRVRARVVLEEADDVIAIPRGALFEKDGRRVVYRRAGGSFEPVDVSVGRNSLSRVVIESGLAPGDMVALRDPAAEAAAPQREEAR